MRLQLGQLQRMCLLDVAGQDRAASRHTGSTCRR